MRCLVENGLAGCELATTEAAVTIVVDALRASAMLTSLMHYGARRILVVREVEEAFVVRDQWPGALLAGERGGPKVPGFDLGNSPLQVAPALSVESIVFSSSNCSRCCVGVLGAPAALLGSTVNATAVARAALSACEVHGADLCIVTAGAAGQESLLVMEDHIAAGAIIAALFRLGADLKMANDRAEACRLLFADGTPTVVTERFRRSHNGQRLTQLGLAADVDFASRLDVFREVPRVVEGVPLSGGGLGALLEPLV